VLQGADAIVFMADSQVSRRDKNLDSLRNLQENLQEQDKQLDNLPLVYAYNKRDLENLLSIEQLNQDLNLRNLPYFPTVAVKGVGVMETLEAISKMALQDIEQRLTATTVSEADEAEDEFSLIDEDTIDLSGGDEDNLEMSFSMSDDLDSLELDTDLDVDAGVDVSGSHEDVLESRPIGYDNTIQIEEFEIKPDTVAHTGTLKESEFFDLKEIEERALRELNEFIEGELGSDIDDSLSFDMPEQEAGGEQQEQAEEEEEIFSLSGDGEEEEMLDFSLEDSDTVSEDEMDFSFTEADLAQPSDDAELQEQKGPEPDFGSDKESDVIDFSLEDSGPVDENEIDFSFSAANLDRQSDVDLKTEETLDDSSLEPNSLLDFTLGGESEEDSSLEDMGIGDDIEPLELSADELDFSMDMEQEDVDELTFSLDEESQEPEDTDFSLDEEDAGYEEPGELDLSSVGEPQKPEDMTFSLGEEGSGYEELGELNLSLDEELEETENEQEAPDFTLSDDDTDARVEPTTLTDKLPSDDEDLMEFTLDDAVESVTPEEPVPSDTSVSKNDIESLNLSEEDLDLSFGGDTTEAESSLLEGLQMSDEEAGEPYDFRITDSVRFEMRHGEEISSVTPFEKQLDELSEDIFTAEEGPAHEEFEPDVSEGTQADEFQAIADEGKRAIVTAKYFYQQGEIARAKQTTSAHIQAAMMYFLAVETALKAVATKYETCNPSIASLKIILGSIEEETGKTISGKTSMLENIVKLKDRIQMNIIYPDQDACELAARICDRFLLTLSQEFLSIDINELSPILPEPTET
jgi:hypothetical protein